MTSRHRVLWLILPLAGLAALAGQETRPADRPTIADLDFLAGEWAGDMWGGRFVAYYSTPEGGRVLSHSRLEKDGKVAFYEFEVFETRDEDLRLQPYPGGRPATGFELVELDQKERRAVFENPEKDYPTRIVYHRTAEDRLVITLSDPHGESDKTEIFDLSAVR